MWTMTVTARFNIFGVPGSGPNAGLLASRSSQHSSSPSRRGCETQKLTPYLMNGCSKTCWAAVSRFRSAKAG